MKNLLVFLSTACFSALVLLLVSPPPLYAVPSFSRTMEVPCSTCHTQWPLLNPFGRAFLSQGFETGETLTLSDMMTLQKGFPVSARLNFRLIDKRTSKDKTDDLTDKDKQLKLRGLHEAEIFVAGKVDDFSYYFELEAEDEWPDPAGDAPGFQVQLAHGYGGWHPDPALNIRAGYTSPFGADGRNTVNRAKPGRYQWAASSMGFLPGVSQAINVYGTVQDLFYSLAWHGNDDDLEGRDPKDVSGRLAYDIAGASFGGFYTASKAYDDTTGKSEDKTNKYGIDAQWQGQALQVNVIYAMKDVDVGNMKDDLIGFFAQYILSKEESPRAAIAVNLDRYTQKDGDDDWTKGAVFLTCFPRENIKLQAGWERTLQAPDAYENKESRLTVVADIGF